ncbi:hypothetical protein PN36_27100 [Candidatus Thiomargarita nelsonii]|uniref:Uncharacterized protein n=1 Tax=Candidatus Thiomargarita nelsonii TaxID=1003181 RepID=A0A4E0QYD4_9GAMM|nr:hypothetical protein PN36_27100 [Candidatus Thiomargarita nelsonii]
METLKQTAIAAISQLPNTANIDDIIVVLYQIRQEKEADPYAKPVSCYDLAKNYIGCIEGPQDLSTNKAYMEGFGL